MRDDKGLVLLIQHLRRDHGYGIRRIAKTVNEPESYVRAWLGEPRKRATK